MGNVRRLLFVLDFLINLIQVNVRFQNFNGRCRKVMRKLIQWERVMHLRNVNQDGGTDTK